MCLFGLCCLLAGANVFTMFTPTHRHHGFTECSLRHFATGGHVCMRPRRNITQNLLIFPFLKGPFFCPYATLRLIRPLNVPLSPHPRRSYDRAFPPPSLSFSLFDEALDIRFLLSLLLLARAEGWCCATYAVDGSWKEPSSLPCSFSAT